MFVIMQVIQYLPDGLGVKGLMTLVPLVRSHLVQHDLDRALLKTYSPTS